MCNTRFFLLQIIRNIQFNSFGKNLSVFSLIILFFPVGTINSQTLDFQNYTTKDGLIADEIYNMHQDNKGYLWIFSNYGTVKYTGSHFKPVLKNLPFKESFIYTMYENEKGQKWIANSNAKIYEVKNDSAFLVKGIESVTETLKNQVSEIFKLVVDDSLNIYVITKGYSYKLVRKKGSYEAVNMSKSFKEDSVIYKISDYGKEALVVANREMMDGLDYIDKSRKTTYLKIARTGGNTMLIKNPLYGTNFMILASHPRNLKKYDSLNYYFIYSNAFVKIDRENKLSLITLKSTLLNFTRDGSGHFWICCASDGIYELNEQGEIVNHYLENTTVNDILIDHQGGLWATSPGLGLFYCGDTKTKTFTKESPLGIFICLSKVIGDTLYIANEKGEVVSISSKGERKVKDADNLGIKDIELHNNKLLLSNTKALMVLGKENKNFTNTYQLSPAFLKIVSLKKDELIACTRKTIVYIKKNEVKKIIHYDNKINTIESYANQIWIATTDGVFRTSLGYDKESKFHNSVLVYDTVKLNRDAFLKRTSDANIIKIVKDKKEGLWFCSRGSGLFYLKGENITTYTKGSELPDDLVNDLFFTDNNLVLLATNSGLYVTKNSSLKNGTPSWKRLCIGTVQTCVFFHGKIYAGANNGLRILENNDEIKKEKIHFNLTSVVVDSRIISPSQFKGLTSGEKNLEFNFDFVDFTKDRPQIKYLLSGSDSSTGYVENLNFRLGQLLPGSYSLTVYPDTYAGKKAAINIPFYIEPPFWQTTSFRIISIVVSFLLVFLTLFFILRYRRQKEAVKIKNEQLLLEYKLIALKAQINPHFMSNCLSAIQDLIMNGNSEKATFYIAQFGLLVRQILEFSSKQLITLQEELDLLELYIELEQLRFENKFDSYVNVDPSVILKEIEVPPLILNPLVENAIWHGLLPMQSRRNGELKIEIKKDTDQLILIIEDNGVGRSGGKNEISNNKNKSYGVKITEQRLSNINYLHKSTTARIVYEDLLNEKGIACGTKVFIYLPDNLKSSQNEYD